MGFWVGGAPKDRRGVQLAEHLDSFFALEDLLRPALEGLQVLARLEATEQLDVLVHHLRLKRTYRQWSNLKAALPRP